MAAYSELNSDACEITHEPQDDHELPCSQEAVSDAPDYLAFAPSRDRPRWGRALLKPLIAIVTSQYVIVTALVAFAAVTVASETARIVNAQLEPIIAALKRL